MFYIKFRFCETLLIKVKYCLNLELLSVDLPYVLR